MAGESILIVDDNPTNLKLARIVLEGEDYAVTTSHERCRGARSPASIRPRLILMDIQLPDLDGLELTRRLRKDPRYEGVLIVALTAYAMKGDRAKAMDAGCDGYITKPIDIDALVKSVASMLRPG